MSHRVLIADDSALLREGLAGLLERQGHEVVGQEARADALEAAARELAAKGELPDVLITDVRMPPTMTNDGLAAAIRIKTAHPGIAVLVVSQYVSARHAQDLFALPTPPGAGGSGYLLKDRIAQVADFLAALSVVISGGVVIDPEVTRAMMQTSRSGLGELSPRELEVLELMAQGLSNGQIGERLFLSGAAVAKHVSSIFVKLGFEPGDENRRVRAILTFLNS
ncbi:DNA-binding response regulator [Arachnia propionica]|uniref:DNA-binding response regulator n=1 Tax=Arachnia propionica TaxID=1750 RepID=A0A3P1T9P8_9ACTN|nr:response regulator transcription factor [Arachnia propionica]MDO5084464.1 response regulator transcription factor [Arachnia propionica]RRD06060.1 DNA-binding response regulator [Arachnia propionica]